MTKLIVTLEKTERIRIDLNGEEIEESEYKFSPSPEYEKLKSLRKEGWDIPPGGISEIENFYNHNLKRI